MRFICIITFLLFFKGIVYGQQLLFRGVPVDTVEITTSEGYYHFDTIGTTTERKDAYIIAFKKPSNKYIGICKQTDIKLTLKPTQETHKVHHIQKLAFNKLSMLDSLLASLSAGFKKPSIDQLGITDQNLTKLIQESRYFALQRLIKKNGILIINM